MNPGFIRRASAFFIDTMPIILILSLLLSLFVGDLLESRFPNFDEVTAEYQINVDAYYLELDGLLTQYEAEAITKEAYDLQIIELRDQFALDNKELESVILSNYLNVLFYFVFSYAIISYIYNLVTKGQTFGRKLMNIELVGRITWFSLLLREFLWKTMFWVTTLFFGLLIDFIMISFTKNKKTLRDYLSGTQLIFKGTSYPF